MWQIHSVPPPVPTPSPPTVDSGLRAACNLCYQRKRPCDGSVDQTCTRCLQKGLPCVFAQKQRTGRKKNSQNGASAPRKPRPVQPSHPGNTGQSNGCNANSNIRSPTPHHPYGLPSALSYSNPPQGAGFRNGPEESQEKSEAWVQNGAPHHGGGVMVWQRQASSLKRARLSPSQATGLVGMQENFFLSSFFDGMGHLAPFLDYNSAVRVVFDLLAPKSQEDNPGQLVSSSTPEQGASHASFWVCVAMGAAMRGYGSNELMEGYITQARRALGTCFDQPSANTAAAFLMLAYVQEMLGDRTKHKQYMDSAQGVLRAVADRGDPTDASERRLLALARMAVAGNRLNESLHTAAPAAEPAVRVEDVLAYPLETLCPPADADSSASVVVLQERDIFRVLWSGLLTHYDLLRAIGLKCPEGPPIRNPAKTPSELAEKDRLMEAERLVDLSFALVRSKMRDAAPIRTGMGRVGINVHLMLARMVRSGVHNMDSVFAIAQEIISCLEEWRGLMNMRWVFHVTHWIAMIIKLCGERPLYDRLNQVVCSTPNVVEGNVRPLPPWELAEEHYMNQLCPHWHCRGLWTIVHHQRDVRRGTRLLLEGPQGLSTPKATAKACCEAVKEEGCPPAHQSMGAPPLTATISSTSSGSSEWMPVPDADEDGPLPGILHSVANDVRSDQELRALFMEVDMLGGDPWESMNVLEDLEALADQLVVDSQGFANNHMDTGMSS